MSQAGRPPLADRIRAERLRLGLTQAQAAKQIGISQSHFARIETGRIANPKVGLLFQLVAFGFDLAPLFIPGRSASGAHHDPRQSQGEQE